ncbi:aminoacyl-tRNA hydrolase [Mycoplasma nasistruthionis]|uniref:Peptidyl-tRNA hydrolase n=1 Tax=Mycoplasma nasistruthionis TaxID=353852 RepID=A0A4Y6I6B1_9MOLU|nr:aminoacyl-tRNA hydrolase [Mycoplasma nasistruthionis]QCZ36889.1 aminoacyl-tRNA hydrolase [Mycoplasma nasistruthionis]QDF65164.1 aminoacyl-tRNA hydrolase [Mycoplasma nasistruthionis]
MKLIVGLGNPGENYKYTRHNAGFLAIDKICEKLNVELNKSKFNGIYAKVDDLVIAKPLTYMNESGTFIQALCNFFKIQPDDVLVIHDEKDFPLGKSAIKIGGSGGSHNGVLSVIKHLGTENFKRLKIGITIPFEGQLRDFVLGKFSDTELKVLNEVLNSAAEASISYAFNDIYAVMNKFNSKHKG